MSRTLHNRILCFDRLGMMNKTLLCICLDDKTLQLYYGPCHKILHWDILNDYHVLFLWIGTFQIDRFLGASFYLFCNHDSTGTSSNCDLMDHLCKAMFWKDSNLRKEYINSLPHSKCRSSYSILQSGSTVRAESTAQLFQCSADSYLVVTLHFSSM